MKDILDRLEARRAEPPALGNSAVSRRRWLLAIVGVFLLLMTLGMAFTGQVLRFDQDAYWGLGIGASISCPVSGQR